MMSSRQIGSAYTSLKQRVSTNTSLAFFMIKNQMTWRVPRHQNALKYGVAKFNFLPILDKMTCLAILIHRKSVIGGIGRHSSQDGFFILVKRQRNIIGVDHEGIAQHMVNMTMRVQ